MKFYKYQPINKYTITNLAKSKNWVAQIIDFNDPFQFRMKELNQYDPTGKLIHIDERKIKNHNFYKNSIENYGVVCYSTNECSTLLFSHYADNHKGMCLEFDVRSEDVLGMKKVNYKNELIDLKYSIDPDERKQEIINICTRKAKVWEYENEYRQLFTKANFYTDYPGILTGITFGCKTTKDDMELILCVLGVKSKDLSVSKTFIQMDSFHLGICTIPNAKDGTFTIPAFWDGIYEA